MSEKEYRIYVRAVSPVHLSSGKADISLDAEIVHDDTGLPLFPAKRLRGLLYESAIEVVEMGELCGQAILNRQLVEDLFHHPGNSGTRLIMHDLALQGEDGSSYEQMHREWAWLQRRYPGLLTPADVLETYSSIRYQTEIDKETGTAAEHSLHNMRVLDEGQVFTGTLTLVLAEGREDFRPYEELLAVAMANLRTAGMKRNRGFGVLECSMEGQSGLLEAALAGEVK